MHLLMIVEGGLPYGHLPTLKGVDPTNNAAEGACAPPSFSDVRVLGLNSNLAVSLWTGC